VKIRQVGYPSDFSYFWVGARALVAGVSPYVAVAPGGPFHFDTGFMYPLPAALAVVPLAWLPVVPAGVLFGALGMGALAFAMTREGYHRLPILMSFPALWCVSSGQWAPFVTAAALVPGFAWAAAVKPTLGFASFAHRPSWRFVVVGAITIVVSLVIAPRWPVEWWGTIHARAGGSYNVPLLTLPFGPLLLLAAFRWRHADGRLLLAMAMVPQTMLLYDQLALGLIARTRKQALVFGLWSYGGIAFGTLIAPAADWNNKASALASLAQVIVAVYYLPALAVVLWRQFSRPPNPQEHEGERARSSHLEP
jgi:hypothetical protein